MNKNVNIKHAIFSNIFLKSSALVIGYILWSILSEVYNTSVWLEVPLCFYNNITEAKITAPDSIKIQIKGKKNLLNYIDKDNLIAHIDTQGLKPGLNKVAITNENLFLSENILIANYVPNNLIVKLEN